MPKHTKDGKRKHGRGKVRQRGKAISREVTMRLNLKKVNGYRLAV